MVDSDSEEPVEFIYGDDYGDIDIEGLGTHQGTTTRRMEVPWRLARDLYDDLSEELNERPDLYIVVVDANTGFAELANVCVVEANSESEARDKVDEMDEPQNYGKYHIYHIDELQEQAPYSFFR